MALAPLTELDAVNQCLARIGATAVNSLQSQNTTIDAETALRLLRTNSTKLQLKGWHWNQECRTFQPDTEGNIYLPTNTLRADAVYPSNALDVVNRGNRLYNLSTNSYEFTSAVTLELILGLDFNELPAPAKVFLSDQTKLDFYINSYGVDEVTQIDREQVQSSWQALMQEDGEVADYNVLWDNNDSAIIAGRAFSHPLWF